MRMSKFRVQNYKKVQDTDWVSCSNLTAFVGKNESGKSAIFRGLSKLNPSDKEKYDGLKEFPRRRYAPQFNQEDWPVSSAEFILNEVERNELKKIAEELKKIDRIIVTRHYSGKMDIKLIPELILPIITIGEFKDILNKILTGIQDLTAPNGKGDELGQIKTDLTSFFENKISLYSKADKDKQTAEGQVTEIINKLASLSNETWQKKLLEKYIKDLRKFNTNIKLVTNIDRGYRWIETNIPKFIYFNNYDVIQSAINVPLFLQEMTQNPSATKIRTTKCLFKHVGIDIEEIQRLNPSRPNLGAEDSIRMTDERHVKMSSASEEMTRRFSDWWEQRRHRFRYDVDGPSFRIWVSDDLDPSDIELDQRSEGLQYFFSFYLIFLVEAEGEHRNSILLLDEPGLHFHGTQQGKMISFLEKISGENQILYTTHSPFMIDADHLERVRVVYEDKDGTTKVSEDVWPKDRDTLFPLQAALGYSIAQTLFYAKRQLVVEGITDYWILKAASEALRKMGRVGLREDIIIVPAGGVNKMLPLASMLKGHGIEIAILLDGDEPGRRRGKEVQKSLLSDNNQRCVFLGDYFTNKGGTIEDIFQRDLYLKAVTEAYNLKEINLTEEESKLENISKSVELAFKRLGYEEFHKWRPARIILDWIGLESNKISEETFNIFDNIFNDVNKLFTKQDN